MNFSFWPWLAVFLIGLSACTARESISNPQVVGGEATDIAQYPFMVGIAEKMGNEFEYICGASQIEPGVILTAAHCFEGMNMKKNGYLVFHLQRLEDLEDPYMFRHALDIVVTKVTAYVKHEDYDYFDLSAPDLALIFYNRDKVPVKTSQAIIEMADIASDQAVEHELATFIGHGEIDAAAGQYAEELQFAQFPRVDLKTCKKFSAEGYSQLNEEFLCYGYPEKGAVDFCFGDSGGPLFYEDSITGPLLLGIANWGSDPCGLPNEPGVYTRVAAHRTWIQDKIEDYEKNL